MPCPACDKTSPPALPGWRSTLKTVKKRRKGWLASATAAQRTVVNRFGLNAAGMSWSVRGSRDQFFPTDGAAIDHVGARRFKACRKLLADRRATGWALPPHRDHGGYLPMEPSRINTVNGRRNSW